jgi:tetratricopeptide (TPR) repeat protein
MRALAFILALATASSAQNIVMKDGKVIPTKGMRRQGETIIATVELAGGEPGKPAKMGDLGYPLAQIAKLDFPEPPQIRAAEELIAQGKLTDALAQLEPVVKFYEGFRDAPGSWWAPAALRKVQALASAGRDREAERLAQELARLAATPEVVRAANVQIAAGLARKGEYGRALELLEPALKESNDPATQAAASVVQGECLLAAKEWDDAVLAFVQVPVFYPGEKLLLPPSLLGRARAHFAADDLPAARAAIEELRKAYPKSTEARLADKELENIERREKALADPNDAPPKNKSK